MQLRYSQILLGNILSADNCEKGIKNAASQAGHSVLITSRNQSAVYGISATYLERLIAVVS